MRCPRQLQAIHTGWAEDPRPACFRSALAVRSCRAHVTFRHNSGSSAASSASGTVPGGPPWPAQAGGGAPQPFLIFFPLPQGQGWFRPVFPAGCCFAARDSPAVTPLGEWVASCLAEVFPVPLEAGLTAEELIEGAANVPADERETLAERWLDARDPADAVREILSAADDMPSRLRVVALELAEMTGEDGWPAWREIAGDEARPHAARHARVFLFSMGQGPEPARPDRQWGGTDAAAAALHEAGPDEALCCIWDTIDGDDDIAKRLAGVRASGHPEAEHVASSVEAFAASGAPLTIRQGVQLKVALKYAKPPVWRSVQLPLTATLGDLHAAIQVLVRLGRGSPACVPRGRRPLHRPVLRAGRDRGRRERPAPRRLSPGRPEDHVRVRLRCRLDPRDHPAEDDHTRTRPGLSGVRRVRRQLPGRVPVRGRAGGTGAVRPGHGQHRTRRDSPLLIIRSPSQQRVADLSRTQYVQDGGRVREDDL